MKCNKCNNRMERIGKVECVDNGDYVARFYCRHCKIGEDRTMVMHSLGYECAHRTLLIEKVPLTGLVRNGNRSN